MVSAMHEKNEEIKNLNEVNKELLDYIDPLEQKHNFKNRLKMLPMLPKNQEL
jgi:DNA-binding transcriptional regulator GbsR (MarR family)